MNSVRRLGLTELTPKPEFLSTLSRLSNDSLLAMRTSVFDTCVTMGLAPSNNYISLVTRRGTATNPITSKHAEDIWTLTDCLKHKKRVPRVLLRNGKRNKTFHLNSQLNSQRSSSQASPPFSHFIPSDPDPPLQGSLTPTDILPSQSSIACSIYGHEGDEYH